MENKEINELLESKKEQIETLKQDSTQMDIKDFYLNKYHDMFSTILNNRSLEIQGDLDELDQEIKSLEDSLDSLDAQLSQNEQNIEQVQNLENNIYQLFSNIEEGRFELDAKQNKLRQDSIKLFHDYYEVINNFNLRLNKYLDGLISNQELIQAIDELEQLIMEKCFNISLNIKQNERTLAENDRTFNQLEKDLHQQIDELIIEKQSLEKKIVSSSNESKLKLKDELNIRIEHKQSYLNELISAYNELSVKQLKEFNDIYIKNRLINKDLQLQIDEYDELFKRFRTKLLTVDTISNQELKRQKRLKELLEEKEHLDNARGKLNLLESQKTRLTDASKVFDQTILELDNHLSNLKQQISKYKHNQYLHLSNDFDKDLSRLATNVNLVQKELTALTDERTFQMFNPDVNKIEELDKEIFNKERQLNEAINEYNKLKNEYDEFLREQDNVELKRLLDEGKYFEENLPRLKSLREKLAIKIDKISNQIVDLKNELINYSALISEIDDIQNENNNRS